MDTVQMLWIGPALSKLEYNCIDSFIKVGHPVHLFTYAPVANIPEGVICEDANAVLPETSIFCYTLGAGAGSVAAFANLFRYKLLMERGGWWMDADVYCVRPIEAKQELIFVQEPRSRLIHSGILYAKQGHPIMTHLYNEARRMDTKTMRWGQTGAKLLTGMARRYPDMLNYVLPAITFCPIHWGDITNVVRNNTPIQLSGTVRGVHLFREMWRRNKLNPDIDYGIYRQLRSYRQLRATLNNEVSYA